MANSAGIERINIYGGSLFLMMGDLALARGRDPDEVRKRYLVRSGSLNPLYEDEVTMGVNAASPILSDEDKKQVGLLIFATEGGADQCKPASTHAHAALGLPSNVRNFEVKHACYAGVAGLYCALHWIASGAHRGKKALVVASDFSRNHVGAREEYVLGGAAAAVLVSDSPRVIGFEMDKTGLWTTDVYDFYRPDARREMVDGQLSLLAYLDALEGSYADYAANTGSPVVPGEWFRYLIYHMPFPGMAFEAHRTLLTMNGPRNPEDIAADFEARVRPSLGYAARVGSSYGASNFVGLCSLIDSAGDRIRAGDRVGFFSYGSGCIGQFYSGIILPEASETVAAMKINETLEARRQVSVPEYEFLETMREEAAGAEEFTPPRDVPAGWYDAHYRGKRRLALKGISRFQRHYEWS